MQTPTPVPPGGDPTAAIITAVGSAIAAIMGGVAAVMAVFRSWRRREMGTVTLTQEELVDLLRRSQADGDHEAQK